jgi:hypothetical protein
MAQFTAVLYGGWQCGPSGLSLLVDPVVEVGYLAGGPYSRFLLHQRVSLTSWIPPVSPTTPPQAQTKTFCNLGQYTLWDSPIQTYCLLDSVVLADTQRVELSRRGYYLLDDISDEFQKGFTQEILRTLRRMERKGARCE